jgi:hypothetical protein
MFLFLTLAIGEPWTFRVRACVCLGVCGPSSPTTDRGAVCLRACACSRARRKDSSRRPGKSWTSPTSTCGWTLCCEPPFCCALALPCVAPSSCLLLRLLLRLLTPVCCVQGPAVQADGYDGSSDAPAVPAGRQGQCHSSVPVLLLVPSLTAGCAGVLRAVLQHRTPRVHRGRLWVRHGQHRSLEPRAVHCP